MTPAASIITRSRGFSKVWFPSAARHLSSVGGKPDVDLSRLVDGLTREQMEQDPAIADYMLSNFPEQFETEEARLRQQDDRITNWGQRRREAPKPPLNIYPLRSVKRCPDTEEGSNRCFPMRRKGFIPGVIYGGDPNQGIGAKDLAHRIFVKTPASVIQSELDRHEYALQSRVFDLTLYDSEEQMKAQDGGTVHRVIPRDLQLHPVKHTPYCCNFLRYYPGRPIEIPVTLINEEESPALKREGYLIPINRFVECVIDEGVSIPKELEVECTGLQFKQVIRLDRVIFPDGIRPSRKVLKHRDFMIGPIHGGKGGGEDEEAEQVEVEE